MPHWSRWEASATTFGPVGRVGWTLAILWIGVNGIFRNPLMLLFVVPAGLTLIHAIWRPGWVVPEDEANYHGFARLRPDGRVRDWLFDVDELATTVIVAAVALGIVAAVIYGNPIVKLCAIAGSLGLFAYLFFRRFFDRV